MIRQSDTDLVLLYKQPIQFAYHYHHFVGVQHEQRLQNSILVRHKITT